MNLSQTENGCYIPLAQVVLAIETLVTAVVAVTVEDNQTLAMLYLCYIEYQQHQHQFHWSGPFLKRIMGKHQLSNRLGRRMS